MPDDLRLLRSPSDNKSSLKPNSSAPPDLPRNSPTNMPVLLKSLPNQAPILSPSDSPIPCEVFTQSFTFQCLNQQLRTRFRIRHNLRHLRSKSMANPNTKSQKSSIPKSTAVVLANSFTSFAG